MKAVFLDRDGVLCEDTDYITSFSKLHIFSYAKQAIEIIHQKGYLAILVSNQSAIARGMMTERLLQEINRYLQKQTGVDAIYYCPHLPPDDTMYGQNTSYRIFCQCRKPGNGLILRAAKQYDINLSESYMVGDRETDIEAGKNANVRTVLLNQSNTQTKADMTYEDLLQFAKCFE